SSGRTSRELASLGQDETPAPRYVQTVFHFIAQAKLTLEQVADQTGSISLSKLSAMCRGRAPVTPEDARTLGRVLGCSPDELVSPPPGAVIPGSVLAETHDMGGRPLPGATLEHGAKAWAAYQLGLLGDQPSTGFRSSSTPAGDQDDMPEAR